MDYQQLVNSLSPEMYDSLQRAVELGKWPNGQPLTPEQRATCLQAIIAYDAMHKPEDERVGYIHTEKHDHCGSEGDVAGLDEPQALKWKN